MSGFEIVQTEPEGEGRQPYYLRLTGANGSDKIVHSENYAHRSGAEGAFISTAREILDIPDGTDLSVKWNADRTKGHLMTNGWMATHATIGFTKDFEPEAKVPARTAKKATAKKAASEGIR